jgi:hypothetical protein
MQSQMDMGICEAHCSEPSQIPSWLWNVNWKSCSLGNCWFNLTQLWCQLMHGFVQSITNCSWLFDDGVEFPVVQVLCTDHGSFQTYSSCFDKVKIVCLPVVDDDGNRLLACVVAHLSDMAVHLWEGHALLLNTFNDYLMKPDEQSPPMAVIMIVQMDVIWSGPILIDETNMHTLMLGEMPVAGGE